jgi:hypothetical protein
VVVVFLFFTQPIALRLVCHGDPARSESTLRPRVSGSIIKQLTQSASLFTTGLDCLEDGCHHAVYVGRGARRDVYHIGFDSNMVLKLCTHESERRLQSNQREVTVLLATQRLPQTPVFYYYGDCDVVTDGITLRVTGMLTSYAGPSLDRLMQKHFALPFDLTTANFFVAAYQDLAMMLIDGIAEQIVYTDVRTAKVTTVIEPTQHVLGEEVPVVIVETKLREFDRHAFDSCLDRMFAGIELQCDFAEHKSCYFLSKLISKHFNHFFQDHSAIELETVKQNCLDRFERLWLDVLAFRGR